MLSEIIILFIKIIKIQQTYSISYYVIVSTGQLLIYTLKC